MRRQQRSPAHRWDAQERERRQRLDRVQSYTRRASAVAGVGSLAISPSGSGSGGGGAEAEDEDEDAAFGQRAIEFVEAAAVDDIATIRSLASAGVSSSLPDSLGRYAIHLAAAEGKLHSITTLLELGASTSQLDEHGTPPMHFAAAHGQADAIRLLVRLGAPVHAQNHFGETALHFAAAAGSVDAARALLECDLARLNPPREVVFPVASDGLRSGGGGGGGEEGGGRRRQGNGEGTGGDEDSREEEEEEEDEAKGSEGSRGSGRSASGSAGGGSDAPSADNDAPGSRRGGGDRGEHVGVVGVGKADGSPGGEPAAAARPEPRGDADPVPSELACMVAKDGRSSLHWAASGGHNDVLELLVLAGAAVNLVDCQGHTAMQLALHGRHTATLRVLVELGADIDGITDSGLSLLHAAIISQRSSQGPDPGIVRAIIELGHRVDMPIITRAVEYRLWEPAQMMMHAYIKSESIVTAKTIRFIQTHLPNPEARFDDCILYSPWPLWACLVVCDGLEQAAAHSTTQAMVWQALIANYVQKAVAMCEMLHGPEEEDRKFKDTGRMSLKDILEPNIRGLGSLAISDRGPIDIAGEHRYTRVFETHSIQKYLAFKWKGGRELNSKLDRLSEELMARSSLLTTEWKTTTRACRFLLAATCAILPVDDGKQSTRISHHKRVPAIIKRIFQNQGIRCRQMFAIPQIRYFIEIWPQLCIMFLYTFGEPESIGSFMHWNPDSKLFGLTKKAPLRRGEIIFIFYLVGLVLSELQQASHNVRLYFTDAFNYFDIVVLGNFMAVVMIRLLGNAGGKAGDPFDSGLLITINILMSVGGTCLWIRLLEIFGVHPTLGPLLEMIKKMLKDLCTFLVLLNCVMMGFAEAFYFLFHEIPNYNSWKRTYLTLLSNLLGEELQYTAFDNMSDSTLSFIGKILQTLYVMIAAVLLLTLLIAMLSDNFRRMSDNIHAEWTWGKAMLVQRVSGRADLTHPPFNIIQPLFSVIGNVQQNLPPGYPVDALFLPQFGVDDAQARTLGGGHWYPAVITRAPGYVQLGTLSGFVSSDWGYLQYHVMFDDPRVEKLNRDAALPVRGRRAPFPLLIMYGRREARYLLDLLGFWPVAYYVVNLAWVLLGPYIAGVITYLIFGIMQRELRYKWVAWAVVVPMYGFVVAGMYGTSFLGAAVMWFFWGLQLCISARNIARGGVRWGQIKVKKKSAAEETADLVAEVKKHQAEAKAGIGGATDAQSGAGGDSEGVSSGAESATVIRRTARRLASEKRERAANALRAEQRRRLLRVKQRCRYMSREQLNTVMRATAYASNVKAYDKKTQQQILGIDDTMNDMVAQVQDMALQCDEFERSAMDHIDQRGADIHAVLQDLLRERDEAAGGSGAAQESDAKVHHAMRRRKAAAAADILAHVQKPAFVRALARFKDDLESNARRDSRRRSSFQSAGAGARRSSRKISMMDRRKASRMAV